MLIFFNSFLWSTRPTFPNFGSFFTLRILTSLVVVGFRLPKISKYRTGGGVVVGGGGSVAGGVVVGGGVWLI